MKSSSWSYIRFEIIINYIFFHGHLLINIYRRVRMQLLNRINVFSIGNPNLSVDFLFSSYLSSVFLVLFIYEMSVRKLSFS